jgi:hypothetical protein
MVWYIGIFVRGTGLGGVWCRLAKPGGTHAAKEAKTEVGLAVESSVKKLVRRRAIDFWTRVAMSERLRA